MFGEVLYFDDSGYVGFFFFGVGVCVVCCWSRFVRFFVLSLSVWVLVRSGLM